jgi:hypothetical protein
MPRKSRTTGSSVFPLSQLGVVSHGKDERVEVTLLSQDLWRRNYVGSLSTSGR